MTKIKGSVTKLVKEPIETLKKGVKTAIKPATAEGTGAVFIGATLGAPIGFLYHKGFGMLESKFPDILKDNILGKILKFALPLLPIYFVKRFNIPFGSLINGTLLSIFVVQIIMEIWGLVRVRKNTVTEPGSEIITGNLYAEF